MSTLGSVLVGRCQTSKDKTLFSQVMRMLCNYINLNFKVKTRERNHSTISMALTMLSYILLNRTHWALKLLPRQAYVKIGEIGCGNESLLLNWQDWRHILTAEGADKRQGAFCPKINSNHLWGGICDFSPTLAYLLLLCWELKIFGSPVQQRQPPNPPK